jgi:hypothetical protein
MGTRTPEAYQDVADAAWRWVLAQVRWDDGPWVPTSVPVPATGRLAAPAWDRDGLHSGIGGLAYLLAEVRLARPWTTEERRLADAISDRVRAAATDQRDATYFDGLVSTLGILTALEAPGAEDVVRRLTDLATPDGWPQTAVSSPRFRPDARLNDLTLGTAGVLLAAVWLLATGAPGSRPLAQLAAEVLVAETVRLPTGATWPFVSARHLDGPYSEMPNFSHGLAGIATTLALAGRALDRPDLTALARSGAEHLVSLADTSGEGFVVPRSIPSDDKGDDEVTWNWCHGPAGTSLLFVALDRAGVEDVRGESPLSWQRRCLRSVRSSGVPARLHPGFWDNDGRCCGTAGVADVFLDSWQRSGDDQEADFGLLLADDLVDRAVRDGSHAYWRFVEHRADEPLLPPGVGWMQGACGIASVLFRATRVVRDGAAALPVRRMDNWWALPEEG